MFSPKAYIYHVRHLECVINCDPKNIQCAKSCLVMDTPKKFYSLHSADDV